MRIDDNSLTHILLEFSDGSDIFATIDGTKTPRSTGPPAVRHRAAAAGVFPSRHDVGNNVRRARTSPRSGALTFLESLLGSPDAENSENRQLEH